MESNCSGLQSVVWSAEEERCAVVTVLCNKGASLTNKEVAELTGVRPARVAQLRKKLNETKNPRTVVTLAVTKPAGEAERAPPFILKLRKLVTRDPHVEIDRFTAAEIGIHTSTAHECIREDPYLQKFIKKNTRPVLTKAERDKSNRLYANWGKIRPAPYPSYGGGGAGPVASSTATATAATAAGPKNINASSTSTSIAALGAVIKVGGQKRGASSTTTSTAGIVARPNKVGKKVTAKAAGPRSGGAMSATTVTLGAGPKKGGKKEEAHRVQLPLPVPIKADSRAASAARSQDQAATRHHGQWKTMTNMAIIIRFEFAIVFFLF